MDIQSFRQLKAGDEVKVIARFNRSQHALEIGSRAIVTETPGINADDVRLMGVDATGTKLVQWLNPNEIELAEPLFEVVAETTVTVVAPQVDRLRSLARGWQVAAAGIRPPDCEEFDSAEEEANDELANTLDECARAVLEILGE